MYKTIVVPLNGSAAAERSLPVARAIAEREDAAIVLVVDIGRTLIAEPLEYLQSVAASAGIDADLRVTELYDVVETLDSVVRTAPDPLVVMCSHGRSGVTRALVGSEAEGVLRQLGASIVLIGPSVDATAPVHLETVVVCTDGSDAADAVIPVARQWIDDLGLGACAVQVIDPEITEEMPEGDSDLSESATVAAFATRLGTGTDWDVLHGHVAASAIADFAAQRDASLIAIATHGRSGISRLTVGSTTADVVRDAPCPVLVVPSAQPAGD